MKIQKRTAPHEMIRWQWHQQIICISPQTDNHASICHAICYRLDALPITEPTVSKHSSQPKQQKYGIDTLHMLHTSQTIQNIHILNIIALQSTSEQQTLNQISQLNVKSFQKSI